MDPFRGRLDQACAARGRLCVGIDPHPALIEQWGEPVDAVGLERVARGLLEAIGERVAVVKPQSAFFEAHGSAGVAVLERVIADAHAAGALVIVDAKRGDIGSSNTAYAEAYLADGSPLAGDALTVSPYLGVRALRPFVDRARETGRGLYVLCRTSNPEGATIQLATTTGSSVAQVVVDAAATVNSETGDDLMGLVIGATRGRPDVELSGFGGSILVPGVGAQGGRLADLPGIFGPALPHTLPTTSREVMGAGPDPSAIRDIVSALLEQSTSVFRAEEANA